jgi:hypothetical protein
MTASKIYFTKATYCIRKLRGGSQPVLVQADDGSIYVVKFFNNLQGPNLLFIESMGTELFGACGLRVPSWKLVRVTDAFIDRYPECWIQTSNGSIRPSAGLCFGSRFLGMAETRLFEILPGAAFQRIRNRASFWLSWLVDICAEHADNRQAIFVKGADSRLLAHFVDNGHLFGGPEGHRKVHFSASRYLDPRIYPNVSSMHLLSLTKTLGAIDADRLRLQIGALPEDWKTASAIQAFDRCMQRLSQPVLLEHLTDAIVDSVARRTKIERFALQRERNPQAAVLRSRIQAGTARTGFTKCGVCHLARG